MRRRSLLVNTGGGGTAEGHEYVEIGGVKWATTNIGAEKPTDYGLYFQWGDTNGYTSGQCGIAAYKKPFKWADCVLHNGTARSGATSFTKYNSSDVKTVLEPSDDAATLYWGGDWRMPTTAEFAALSAAVNTEFVSNYQANGILMTDKTDSSKKLFFPLAGYGYDGNMESVASYGYYWSSSLYDSDKTKAYCLLLIPSGVYFQFNSIRCSGLSVRPVLG